MLRLSSYDSYLVTILLLADRCVHLLSDFGHWNIEIRNQNERNSYSCCSMFFSHSGWLDFILSRLFSLKSSVLGMKML